MPDEALAPEKEGPLYADVERVRKPQFFKYEKPDVTSTKASIKLTQSDILKAAVQVIRQGGEMVAIERRSLSDRKMSRPWP